MGSGARTTGLWHRDGSDTAISRICRGRRGSAKGRDKLRHMVKGSRAKKASELRIHGRRSYKEQDGHVSRKRAAAHQWADIGKGKIVGIARRVAD